MVESNSHLEEELVQVAAVVVCWLEALGSSRTEVFDSVRLERERQDAKWGSQRDHPNRTWLAILAEEFGEVAKELL